MQIFPCPFCGPRDEREFHFAGELGKTRPDTRDGVSDADWARYLHEQRNEKGHVREVWMHMPCSELFVLERDSVSMAVIGSSPLRGAAE
ncbi:sarcosine oxidase subunit delta [Rhodalgimonas zhirmunskyi]|uniref:Sarcosine oxidase subunit delta n=1 Tax=Rhodalgimonas zhirmunskyi TaxID=2964767 RepID=A0AAJ1X6T8_9RHOB|nr:sarcosine oxidase subunit delta [Rhodoalgimonas zhirmunskyi]MDQ2095539.1 sarcosine oxidase subunit delta [Rhodoalgimonas zhirmunskyi]